MSESKVQKGSEILNKLEMYTFQTLLELGTLDRCENEVKTGLEIIEKSKRMYSDKKPNYGQWEFTMDEVSFLMDSIRDKVIVPEANWKSKKERLEKLEEQLAKAKALMKNFPLHDLGKDKQYWCLICLDEIKWLDELKKAIDG